MHFGNRTALHGGRKHAHSAQDVSDFLSMYANRPKLHHNVQHNPCGIRLNHAFALWSIVRTLRPTTLIESGVNTGISTYVMRHAAPKAKIISIDPLQEALSMSCRRQGADLTDFKHGDDIKRFYNDMRNIKQPNLRTNRWIDSTNNEYLVGAQFVDFAKVDWGERVRLGELDPQNTLVFFDDHQEAAARLPLLRRFGFRHAIFEDNYPNRGYALKTVFARAGRGDDAKASEISDGVRQNLASYWEFPPMVYNAYPPRSLPVQEAAPERECFLHPHLRQRGVGVTTPLLQPYYSSSDADIFQQVLRSAVVPPAAQQEARQRLGSSSLGWEELAELAFNDTGLPSQQLNIYCHIAYVELKGAT